MLGPWECSQERTHVWPPRLTAPCSVVGPRPPCPHPTILRWNTLQFHSLPTQLPLTPGRRPLAPLPAGPPSMQLLQQVEEETKKKAEFKKKKYAGPMIRYLSRAVDGQERVRVESCGADGWCVCRAGGGLGEVCVRLGGRGCGW